MWHEDSVAVHSSLRAGLRMIIKIESYADSSAANFADLGQDEFGR